MKAKKLKRTQKLFKNIAAETMKPPPDLTVSEWADSFRFLPSETSAEPGRWRTDRAPYQEEIMNAVTDPRYEDVIIMSSAQVGKSEILLNVMGYFIDLDPCPIMLVQPTKDKAKDFSKERIAPMIRDCPTLKNKVKSVKSRDGGNTMLNKSFPGGNLACVGANAPADLCARPVRIVLMDEVDRFPLSAGTEGDPVDLGEKRTTTFHNRKIVKVSTPTIKGVSRIEKEYEGGTKEKYHLPCPNCKELQPLSWRQIDFETVSHRCAYCGFLADEYKWKKQRGEWVAETPDAPKRSFHLNELLSPWRKWQEIINAFKEAKRKGTENLKVWVNTSLGETWEEEGETANASELLARCEDYGAEVPDEVKILTAAVDVQGDRFEIEVIGWGKDRESWGIEYNVIHGDLNQERIWNELDGYLLKTFRKANGRRFGIACTCIDTGGLNTQEVYKFIREREMRRVYGVKGLNESASAQYMPLIVRYSRSKLDKTLFFTIGTYEGKAKVMAALNTKEKGANYCHFPIGRGYDSRYFDGLTAEKMEQRFERGKLFHKWVKIRSRNEPFDIRVYNMAALEILNPNLEMEYMATNPVVKKKRRKKGTRGVS